MKYTIIFEERASKELSRIDKPGRLLVLKKIKQLGEDPDSLSNNIKILKGKYDHFRLRIGRFRVIFNKDDKKITITIIRVGLRSKIYNSI
ncbi:MAG: type II toxin-antitoxin system RelE/ParE family toxin [Acidobacteriota bacterium]